MMHEPTGTILENAEWTTFVQEKELDYHDGVKLVLKRDAAGQDYLVLWNDSDGETERWIYLPLDPDGPGVSATPMLTETLTGKRPLISALGNSDHVFIVDEDPATGRFLRTVRTQLHLLPEEDPLRNNMPPREVRLNVPEEVIREWTTT